MLARPAASSPRRRRRRTARRAPGRPRRASWRGTARGPARRRTPPRRPTAASSSRSRARWSARAAAPPPAGRAPSRSAPGPAWTCRGRRVRRWRRRASRASAAATDGARDARRPVLGRHGAQVEQQRPPSTRPTTGGVARPQRGGVALGQAHGRARQHHAGCAATADGASRRRRPSAPAGQRLGQPLGRARRASAVGVAAPDDRGGRARAASPPARPASACRPAAPGRAGAAAAARPGRGRPSSRPACGPPSSLSPEAVTRSAPARSARRGVGLVGQQRMRGEQAGADVGHDGHAERRPARRRDARGEALDPEVRRVHLEHERRRRPTRRRSRPGDAVGRADLAQPRAGGLEQSGMRKPSPISTSSPRATTISRPAASALATSASAAAPLLTTWTRRGVGHGGEPARPAPPRPRGPRRRWPGRARRRSRRPRWPAPRPRRRKRRAAEVRVHHDAGGVDHRAQRGGGRRAARWRVAVTTSSAAERDPAARPAGRGDVAFDLVRARAARRRLASAGAANTVSVRGNDRGADPPPESDGRGSWRTWVVLRSPPTVASYQFQPRRRLSCKLGPSELAQVLRT